MANINQMKGTKDVLKKLNKEIKKVRGATKAGVTAGCLIIKAASVKKTPVDLGNLRNSAFVKVTGDEADNTSPSFDGDQAGDLSSGHSAGLAEMKQETKTRKKGDIVGVVGYTAFYAFYVHEAPMTLKGTPRPTKGKYWDGGENKFLESAVMESSKKVLDAIKKRAKIK